MRPVNPISINQLGDLGVDEKGKLYWQSRPVVTEQKVTLEWWVNVAVVAAAVATVVQASVDVMTSLCRR